jgi:L-2-hydroxyglutarate oxidase LhgO
MTTADVQTIVVGAGVVGLAIGAELARRGDDVMVLEQHGLIGSETSSRNSEVIHAGIYYPTGSLRATLCVRGKQLLYAFCAENGVDHSAVTKLLVATDDKQLPKLAALHKTAVANGVEDLRPLTGAEARALEPELSCVAALLSPSTGIVDSHGLMTALEGHIATRGGQVVLEARVTSIVRSANSLFQVTLADGSSVTCQTLVLSAGLHVTPLARTLAYGEAYRVPDTFFAKGQYYALSGSSPFKRHIYPMPDGAWLGLHATVDLGGRCKFGPDIEWTPEIDYNFQPEKIEKFLDFIRTYYPGLDSSRLHADYTGVRPKLYREGEPVPDFRIDGPRVHGHDGLVVLAGIESPGLTSSLAIGCHVADLLARPDV